ncbi:MAG: GatB/YqeY domain-containing protein [Sphingomonadales bacterium]|nr:GatB/YqeY domain-containing protein [Sphingomonadales bacterium]
MLREKIQDSLKEAMRAKETRRVSTLRLILAAVKDRDIAARTQDKSEEDDDAVINAILAKMVKQRRDSIQAYEEAGRCELAERERDEIGIIQGFLPKQMSDEEISSACHKAVDSEGAQGLKDVGRVMGALKAKFAGRMDFSKAAAEVREILS